MEERTQSLSDFIRRHARIIGVSAVAGLLLSVAGITVAGYVAYEYRAELFQYFADEYISRTASPSESGSAATATPGRLDNVFSLQERIIDAVDAASPAVVSVIARKDVPVIERYYEQFGPFFQIPRYRQDGTKRQQVGGGSGFFVSADGLIVTNRHVVSDTSADYAVLTRDGTEHPVTVVAKDSFLDVAVLKVENATTTFPHLAFGNSDTIKPGQFTIAIGNALGEFQNSVSVGVISGLSRSITAGSPRSGQTEQLNRVIQTDAAINPGNSGGPLLNTAGEVIGVNVAVAQGSENIGFALPANAVQQIVESVKETGEIVRPFLGVRYVTITDQLARENNLSVSHGALIQRGSERGQLAVLPGSPADKAGIVENDIILRVAGEKVTQEQTLAQLIRGHDVGEEVSFRVLHDGNEKTVTVTLEKAPESL